MTENCLNSHIYSNSICNINTLLYDRKSIRNELKQKQTC